jgi:primary-amine oxidase
MNHDAHAHVATFEITLFDPKELYVAGDCPYAARVIRVRRSLRPSIVDEDLVHWYTMNAQHVPRPEVKKMGFRFEPVGFLKGSPSIDLPRAESFYSQFRGAAPTAWS